MRNLITYLACVLIIMLTTQCEGPAGMDGEAGNVTCLKCHGSDLIITKQAEFQQSAHNVGAIAVDYAGGRASCAPCHSHELFVTEMELGDVEGDITNPSAWKCSTCHGIHDKFSGAGEFALRTTDPVTGQDGTIMDMGSSNICATCHQTRRNGPTDMGGEYVDLNGEEDDGPGGAGDDKEYLMPAGMFFLNSTHYGPHHGPQANVVWGSGYAEIAGALSYATPGSKAHASGGCVACHMAESDGSEGGHTFMPTLDGCNVSGCHASSALTTFDVDGKQTEIEGLLEDLRDLLVAQGVVELVKEYEYEWNNKLGYHDTVLVESAYEPIVGVYSVAQSQAFFNWVGLEEDRSMGVHNFAYSKALLQNSIDALTP